MTLNARRLCGESVTEDDDPNVKAAHAARSMAAWQMFRHWRRDQRGNATDGDEEDESDTEDDWETEEEVDDEDDYDSIGVMYDDEDDYHSIGVMYD
jgi:hypothetical protein